MSDYYQYSLTIEGKDSTPAYASLIEHMAGNEITIDDASMDIWHLTVDDIDMFRGPSGTMVYLLDGSSRNDSIERIAQTLNIAYDVNAHGYTMEPVAF